MSKRLLKLLVLHLALSLFPLHSFASIQPLFQFAAGLLNNGQFPESDRYTTDDDIVILTNDGVELTANIFVPTQLTGSAPAVVFINSWGMNEYQYLQQAAALAERGYVVLSYSTRGFGESTGQIDTAGPKDIADYSQVIDFLLNNYPVNPNAVGTAGISYGSGISLIGAAQDERVKAVAAMSSWGSLLDALYGNQTPRLAWGELLILLSDLQGSPDPVIAENWNIIKNQKLDQLPAVIEWADERSPISYVEQLNQNNTAVYFAKAYGDNLFQANSLLEMYSQLSTPKYIDLLTGTHATAELLPPLLGIGEDRIWNNVYQWFDIHLKGESNELSQASPFQMKVKFQDRYEGFDGFPIKEAAEQKYYLHPRSAFDNGDLETFPYEPPFWMSKDNTINSWTGSLFSTQIPVLSQLLEQLEVPVVTNIYAASDFRGIYFNTDKLQNVMKIRGNPTVNLVVQPHYDKAQLVGYLYDMDSLGNARLITHGVSTLPQAEPGQKIEMSFELVTTAYDVPEGHRVVLAIDTKDPQYKRPTSDNYFIDFEFSRQKQSTFTIPTLQAN